MMIPNSLLFAALLAPISVTATYTVTFYSGASCTSAVAGQITVPDAGCAVIPDDIQAGAQSATIVPTDSEVSGGTYLSFYTMNNCGGAPIVDADEGCVTFSEIGVPQGLAVNGGGLDSSSAEFTSNTPSNVTMSFDEAFERARRSAGLEVDTMPDAPPGFKWLTVYVGQWVMVPENVTLKSFYAEYVVDIAALQTTLNFGPSPDDETSNFTLAPSKPNILSERQFIDSCTYALFCLVPTIPFESGVTLVASQIKSIINSAVFKNLWGAANNGYIIAVNTHYFFIATENKVVASQCSTSDTDKDTIISVLTAALRTAEAERDIAQESLGVCLNTNHAPAPTSGHLTFDGWTTRTSKSRCPTVTCK